MKNERIRNTIKKRKGKKKEYTLQGLKGHEGRIDPKSDRRKELQSFFRR